MKAFIFITLFFVSIPIAYLGYQNVMASGVLDKPKLETISSNGSNYEIVVIETSKFSFLEDNTKNAYIIVASVSGQEVSIPTTAGEGNIKGFFSDWKRVGGDGNRETLSSPAGCNFINLYIAINTKSKNLSDNLERAYCTLKKEPNYTFIP